MYEEIQGGTTRGGNGPKHWRAKSRQEMCVQFNTSDVRISLQRSEDMGSGKTRFTVRESHVHDVIITKEAPNYRLE